MVTSSNEALPLGGGADPHGSETLGQNSFELFTNDHKYQMPASLAGRSVSQEEGLVAMALLGCAGAGKRPPSRSSGGARVNSGAWGDLLALGGEDVHELGLSGRKHLDGPGGAHHGSRGGAGVDDPKAQRQRQEEEERQQLLEMEELANSMPSMPPFSGVAGSRGSSSNSRTGSRKARLLSRKSDSASMWPTSTDSGLNFLLYKSSSGSGSSGGGGPPGEGGGQDGTENAGGGRSSGSSSGGGGRSWELAPNPGALTSSAGAGGAATTHDDVIAGNHCSRSNTSNSKFDFGQQHPMRQQSFQPDRDIADLPSAKDICPDLPVPGPPATAATYGGGVRDWQKAVAAATITTTIATSRSTATAASTNSGGVFVPRGHPNASVATSACPPNPHSSNHHRVKRNGPIAPAPARRVPVQPPVPHPPAPVQHERKPSYNLLAMMIPDISKLGKPPTAAPLHGAPGAVPGAAPGGAGFPAGFAPAAAGHFSPADPYLRVGVEDGGVWTRQAALARYRRKKKRRLLVKVMRENDPTVQEQNEARKRPRKWGKFTKERPDFVSICDLQKAAKSRSISGELPLRERESTTPPPQPSARRGAATATGRSTGDRAQSAAGTRTSPRVGGGGGQ
eukprot:g2840.t1